MKDDDGEHVLQLLANYENMARAIETFLHRIRTDPNVDLQAPRYRALLGDLEQVVPVWKEYAAATRVKLMLERRRHARAGTQPDDEMSTHPR